MGTFLSINRYSVKKFCTLIYNDSFVGWVLDVRYGGLSCDIKAHKQVLLRRKLTAVCAPAHKAVSTKLELDIIHGYIA